MPPELFFPTDKRLILSCRKCTRQSTFFGSDMEAAIAKAVAAHWIHDAWPPDREQYVCPRCPSSIRDDAERKAKADALAASLRPTAA